MTQNLLFTISEVNLR